ncbi:LysR family transcriptional regulator [Lacticaseibacillus hulanensis]|uniref:LysR family transcriptional regulator n=1 Tax=Lacticaseibacillus hulanensis TaxID=2493111 RepID=UPI0013E3ADD9|nr:LysR family transcriptional regulator [Lacticaseibacillus hulanensis]
METQKLQAFITVAATLSYTEAATQLFTTQATVSKQILALEKQWGVLLFSREHRQVHLTASGADLLPKAQAVVAAANALETAAVQAQRGNGRLLRIKTIPSIASYRAFNQIAAFHAAYPDVKLQLAEVETNVVDSALKTGAADIVFTRLFGQPDAATEFCFASDDQLCVVVRKDSELAGHKVLTASDLASADLLVLGESTRLFQPVAKLFADAGITPHIAYKGQRIDLIIGMVRGHLGVSVMMEKTIDLLDFPELTTVPLEPTVTSKLGFLRQKGQHDAASNAFWAFINSN